MTQHNHSISELTFVALEIKKTLCASLEAVTTIESNDNISQKTRTDLANCYDRLLSDVSALIITVKELNEKNTTNN